MKDKSSSREFENKNKGEKIRYDKGKPGAPGHEAHDHYHRYNLNSRSKRDKYLDKDGNPVHKNDDASHLYPQQEPACNGSHRAAKSTDGTWEPK